MSIVLPDLPIAAHREQIIAALRSDEPVLIIAGETGSGKTTQLPKYCVEAGLAKLGRIGCTQPRRVAAISVSKRVAEELDVQWGKEVGCKMRFNDDTSRETRVKFMTDGILLAEIQSDPLLRQYSAIILDEAHERSLNIDFLLGYLKTLLPKRPGLKLIITSATIDTEAFSQAYGGARVIEVSGRLFPVETRYVPANLETDLSQAVLGATEDALIETHDGDILVFMPTERDIRDTAELLEGRLGKGHEVLSLFGRQSNADQQRAFSPGAKRRVILATNIAETSITLPRIRYVIDTGLARISRYNPRTRTKRLPVEAVSQSSANQRAGRAGRIRDGVCVRLYDEEDFNARPRFSQPEIQRANLAEVILRMKAFRLGEIEDFPFLHPPSAASIRSGYDLLHELGALDDTQQMTAQGRELARLPLDPTLGRMLLQAQRERVLPDMLILAAGLSIPDPRERPEDAKEQAAAAHKAFRVEDSDFLSLLKIWRAAPPHNRSQGEMRRFCKINFISFSRMREWRDLWRQLAGTLEEEGVPLPDRSVAATEEALHRCVLSGFIANIAQRDERNVYKASNSRVVTLFPGSNLYERRPRPPKAAKGKPSDEPKKEDKSRQPQWLVAGEIVQTSQLFARNNARINPEWVVELAPHLCHFKHSEPRWDAKAARVLAWERTLVHGLEVRKRKVDFGGVDPVAATEMFIRGALVEGDAIITQPFFVHNQALRQKIETSLARVRSSLAFELEEAIFNFYKERLTPPVSSVHDLNRLVAGHAKSNLRFLFAQESDWLGEEAPDYKLDLFPDAMPVGNAVLPLTYAYQPGTEEDGVTVDVPLPTVADLSPAQVQWLVPGLREEISVRLLRALPKAIRKTLLPLEIKAREMAAEFRPGRGEFLTEAAEFLSRKYQMLIRAAYWPAESIPAYLRPRLRVVDKKNATVAEGRDLETLQASLKTSHGERRSSDWERVARAWEKHGLKTWSFGDLPPSVVVEMIGGVPLLGYPGLQLEEDSVCVRLFRHAGDADAETPTAIRWLAETALARDAAWLWKELRQLVPTPSATTGSSKKPALSFHDALSQLQSTGSKPSASATAAPSVIAVTPELMQSSAHENLLAHTLRLEPLRPLTEARYQAMLESTRRSLPQLAHQLRERTRQLLAQRQALLAQSHRYPGWDADLNRLLSPDFLAVTPFNRLTDLPRYLKAMQTRAERAALNPAKDAAKAENLKPYDYWEEWVPVKNQEEFRWLLEEYRVSLFAPELGTAQPVSVKRLDALAND